MPGPSQTPQPVRGEDAFFELLAETIEGLDRPVRAQFLQRFFRSIAQIDLTEEQGFETWEQVLARRTELAESLGKPVSLKTAMVDVLASSSFLRVPILMEYEELKRLQINAATDPLTGLYNRRLFEETFEKELNRAQRYGQSLTLVVLDLHKFKEVNDRYGHPVGDQVLQAAANTFRKTLRTSDSAFRIGGDEFALLLPQTETEQATALCRRLRSIYAATAKAFNLDVFLAMDYGVAVYPQDGDQPETLRQVADQRLYGLKHAARANSGVPPEPLLPPPPPPQPQPPTKAPAERAAAAPPAPKQYAERRKWERVSLAGTRAHAQLTATPGKTARVLDLSYGGIALEMEGPDQLGEVFQAVLHVPILPPVRVSLRRVYKLPGPGETTRIGCSFVS